MLEALHSHPLPDALALPLLKKLACSAPGEAVSWLSDATNIWRVAFLR